MMTFTCIYRKVPLRDQFSACSIDDLTSCCWLLGTMSFTSSAKNKWLQVSSFSRSFINIRNRRGPSTPLFTIPSLERWPPNFTRNVLFFRNASIQCAILRWIYIATIVLISRRWHTEPNAFETSKYKTSTASTWPVMPVINPSATIRFVRHERLGMNPCCAPLKMEAVFRYCRMFALTILSRILQITEVKQIGL